MFVYGQLIAGYGCHLIVVCIGITLDQEQKERICFKNNHVRHENKFYESTMIGVVEGCLIYGSMKM